ncbi:MAG: HAD family hydrolase [Candidatus Melainabacteria bacterium]|nr:HAD family hydrolase [Candidatus Melainabacteria bacterium]
MSTAITRTLFAPNTIAQSFADRKSQFFDYLDLLLSSFIKQESNTDYPSTKLVAYSALQNEVRALGLYLCQSFFAEDRNIDFSIKEQVEIDFDQIRTMNPSELCDFVDDLILNYNESSQTQIHFIRPQDKNLKSILEAKQILNCTDDRTAIDSLAELVKDDSSDHIVIFDIDGTLRDQNLYMTGVINPDLEPAVAEGLQSLNQAENRELYFFTGRGSPELTRAKNVLSLGIPGLACYGYERILENGTIEKASPQVDPQREAVKQRLINQFDQWGISRDDYIVHNINGAIYALMSNPDLFELIDKLKAANEKIIADSGFSFDYTHDGYIAYYPEEPPCKGGSMTKFIEQILEARPQTDRPLKIYYFGDSKPDLEAMKSLQGYRSDQIQTYGVAVGPDIKDDSGAVTHCLNSCRSVQKLLDLV